MTRRIVAAAILLSVALPFSAVASKDLPRAEVDSMLNVWRVRCSDLAAAENQPSLEEKCRASVRQDLVEVANLSDDPAVSDQIWNLCRAESGYSRTGDFHAWASCMRVAKTRPGLGQN